MAVVGLLCLTFGCGKPLPEGMPKLYPCSVNVTMNGQVLTDAVVYFYPEDESLKDYYATGCTDENGQTEMKTRLEYPGVVQGTFKVALIKTIINPDWKRTPDMPPEEMPDSISPFDFRFSLKETTPFTCEVKPEKNTFSFDIEQKGKPKQGEVPGTP
ncbi:MAG: hypothetical protein Q4G68_02730 [Planctomycetia bacterium]|nr:hypothetical protein [Planctomycetia bacterium]